MTLLVVYATAAFGFIAGFLAALELVGYGVRGGLKQIVQLQRYRSGKCQCALCRQKGTVL